MNIEQHDLLKANLLVLSRRMGGTMTLTERENAIRLFGFGLGINQVLHSLRWERNLRLGDQR